MTGRIGDGDATTQELMDRAAQLPDAQRLLEAAALSPRLAIEGASTYRVAAEQSMLDGRQDLIDAFTLADAAPGGARGRLDTAAIHLVTCLALALNGQKANRDDLYTCGDACMWLGVTRALLGEWTAAESMLRRAVERFEDAARIPLPVGASVVTGRPEVKLGRTHHELAELLRFLGRTADAETEYDNAASAFGNDSTRLDCLAASRALLG